jgi:hypothetical protein
MERFQRAKYLRQVSDVRRELDRWSESYNTMLTAENQPHYTDRQLRIAESRADWLDVVIEKLSEAEDTLAEVPDDE